MIGIFDKIHRILNGTCSHVDGIKSLGPYLLGPLKILIVTDFIGNILMP